MIHDVVCAEYIADYRINLTFDNGKTGIVDFQRYITKGGVFHELQDVEHFKRFKIDRQWGVLTWEGGIDLAPETLYAEATGEPLPEWMLNNAEVSKDA